MDTIETLRTFVRVVETGSLTAVARQMNASQSTVSRQIAQLEEHFGVRLLHRTTRHLSLTDDGIGLHDHARKVLEAVDGMDRLEPQDDRYKIEGEELWLQGSAEHVLGSMHAGEIFDSAQLPLRYLGFATSFRKEAGTYGKDMEGLIRMHQFDKLEMESFAEAKDSANEHLLFVAVQEYLLQQLKLPYHVLLKCTADIGKPNARGIDMEVWLPGQGKYRETHTADYMTDYQARRLQTRVRTEEGVALVHTNDATAFALGRAMVAIIENYQTAEGDVVVPEVLRPYFAGRDKL